MDNCYLCGKKFNSDDIKKHDEHIIQQAIGGNLKKNDILCSKCGEELGKEIDSPFNKIFEGIATRLDIKTDRNNNKHSSIKGKCINFCGEVVKIDILWKNFKISPLRPFHRYIENNNKIIIYSNKKNANKYKKKIENEIVKNHTKNNKPEIIICDDLDGIMEFSFDMDNQTFKKGLAKIAIGFSSKYNISRENLPLVLEIDKNTQGGKIKDKIQVIPFYPLGVIDRLIEIEKNKFAHYPFHNLILFTLEYEPDSPDGKKVLICYIELFSTFQYYIVLNEEYYGEEIYEYYIQSILKKDDYIVELGRRYYKERDIWLSSLDITEKNIDKKFNNRKDKSKTRWDIEEQLIQEETIKQKYKLDFEDYVCNTINHIGNQVLIFQNKEKSKNLKSPLTEFLNKDNLINEYDKSFVSLEDFVNFQKNLFLFFPEQNDDIFNISSYRKIYYEKNSYKLYCIELSKNIDFFKKYGYLKMSMLEQYIQKETMRKKINQ